jgi:serine/threonine-protein kinase
MSGLAKLQEANRAEVQRLGEVQRQASEALSEKERRIELQAAAAHTFAEISAELHSSIAEAVPSASHTEDRKGGWSIRLNKAELALSPIDNCLKGQWDGWGPPAFEVLCTASLELRVPRNQFGYEGRSHSLWYGDIQEARCFEWFETAFMISPLMQRHSPHDPFSLDPGEEAAKAVWTGMAEYQVAWAFTPLRVGQLDEFIDRWAGWLSDAAQGTLSHPRAMPERAPQGSWRKR